MFGYVRLYSISHHSVCFSDITLLDGVRMQKYAAFVRGRSREHDNRVSGTSGHTSAILKRHACQPYCLLYRTSMKTAVDIIWYHARVLKHSASSKSTVKAEQPADSSSGASSSSSSSSSSHEDVALVAEERHDRLESNRSCQSSHTDMAHMRVGEKLAFEILSKKQPRNRWDHKFR